MTGFLKKLAFLSAFFSKTFALWVILFAVLAFYFPQYFLGIKGYISLLLGVVMFLLPRKYCNVTTKIF